MNDINHENRKRSYYLFWINNSGMSVFVLIALWGLYTEHLHWLNSTSFSKTLVTPVVSEEFLRLQHWEQGHFDI